MPKNLFASSDFQEEEFDYLSLLSDESRQSLTEFYARTDNRLRRASKLKTQKPEVDR